MLQWVRRECDTKDKAIFLISRLEGRKTIFNSYNGGYVVEFERECATIEGKFSYVEEEVKDELPKQEQ